MTELHQAAAAGDLDGVEAILLQDRCNPNQRDVDWSYKTALHWAAAKGAGRLILRPTLQHGLTQRPNTLLLLGRRKESIQLFHVLKCFGTSLVCLYL